MNGFAYLGLLSQQVPRHGLLSHLALLLIAGVKKRTRMSVKRESVMTNTEFIYWPIPREPIAVIA